MDQSNGRRMICDMHASERIEGAFTIMNAQLGRTRSDKTYLRCLLRDRSGEAPARKWTIEQEEFQLLPSDGFVWIAGETQDYQGELQIIIHQIDPHEPTPEQLLELLPTSERPVEEMWHELLALLATLEHPAMAALAQTYLEDEHLMEALRRAPAAKSMHHAYLGGLLEHTLSLLRVAEATLPHYPELNRDVVLTGLFLHDLGKCIELNWATGSSLSRPT